MNVPARFAPDAEQRISFPDARRVMLAWTAALPAERAALLAASGRVAAETLRARDDIVPFARSAMDGYALRACDTRAASNTTLVAMRVARTTFAGDVPPELDAGTAMAITTGGMLPAGADAVVPFEEIERVGDTLVLHEPLTPLDHVFEAGDDAKRGDVLLHAGDVVTPGRAALLAAAGYGGIAVYRRPRVAIVSTGNEIVPIDATPRLGQIRNSNATMLATCVVRDGAELVLSEHARDAEAPLRNALERALERADLVITTGGASTGERDVVKRTLRSLGADFAFESIALRPAKPTGFAARRGRLVAVLPGNPAAAYVAYIALVRGVLRAAAGHEQPYPKPFAAILRGRVHRKDRRHFLMFARVEFGDAGFVAHPLANQCSSLVRTSADANALIVAKPGVGYLESGDAVPVEIIDPVTLF